MPHRFLLALGLMLAAGGAAAQSAAVDIDEALRIARQSGLHTITKAELDDGEWEVYGRNVAGRRVEMEINAKTGAIIRHRSR